MGAAALTNCGSQDWGGCGSITVAADSRLARVADAVALSNGAEQQEEKALALGIWGTNIRDFSETARDLGVASGARGGEEYDDDEVEVLQERLFQAARAGSFKRCVEALGRGADVHGADLRGQTALMLAAGSSSKTSAEAVRFLVEVLSDLEAKDELGWTPLLHACRNNREELAMLLLERGASVKARAGDGSTCTMLAAKDGGDKLVISLLTKQAALDKKDDRGWTVLFVACSEGRSELVRWLIKKQANVREKAKDGSTAVMVAAAQGSKSVGQRLVKRSANINATNSNGDSALLLSVQAGHEAFASWLLEAGADVSLRNNQDKDAMELADSLCLYQLRNRIEARLRAADESMGA